MAWLAVDKDGTEKIFNTRPFRGNNFPEMCKRYQIDYPCKSKFNDKWYDTFTNGYYQVPHFNGVQVPSGTIEKLIGVFLTWEDEPVEFL